MIGDSITVALRRLERPQLNQSHCNDATRHRLISPSMRRWLVVKCPPAAGGYSGGGENFVRILEDWKYRTMCIYGSMVQLYKSTQATAPWDGAGNLSKTAVNDEVLLGPEFLGQ